MDHIAIDIGASGGRVFTGVISDDSKSLSSPVIKLNEIYRFKNSIVKKQGHYFWDIDLLFEHIVKGLKEARLHGVEKCTVGIDTWGVDYVLIDRAGEKINEPFAYRDSRTDGAMESFHKIIPAEEVYHKTGIQFLQFNTLYQLSVHDRDELERAWKILLIPDYLYFLFTGNVFNEETNASTTQLLNLDTKDFDADLLSELGLKREQFAELVTPGSAVGKLKPELKDEYDLPECEFISVATHDTGSAVLGTPLLDDDSVYLSSGTWSLMGIESSRPVNNSEARAHNFTNERGAGDTYRFLKNITGLWLIQEVKRNLNDEYSFEELMNLAASSEKFKFLINCNDACFLNPPDMISAIKEYCVQTGQGEPATISEIARCIIDSLAFSYRYTIEEIETLTGRPAGSVNIIGGGVKNRLLCQSASDVTGKKVTAGPAEATVIGNMAMQMIASGEIESIKEARCIISNSFDRDEYVPQKDPAADDAYMKFNRQIQNGFPPARE